jgi:tartrate/fumarate subfamily iron-sulfur-dependent hydro-lyase beta chain
MSEYHITTPVGDKQIERLRIGDTVTVTGAAFTCRSKLQRYIFDEHHALPTALGSYDVLIHTGPIVLDRPDGYHLVAFGPTSSIRFEKWGARSIRDWGLKIIIGKTTMGAETAAAMKEYHCIHLSPQSICPNQWCESIKITGVELLEEMGSIEAPWKLSLDRLGPFVVDIDTTGSNMFDVLAEQVHDRAKNAYKMLGIPDDFTMTKLY